MSSKCWQCKKKSGSPHICANAQIYGGNARCCDTCPDKCFSFREISEQIRLRFGSKPSEDYLQAILNSNDMRLG